MTTKQMGNRRMQIIGIDIGTTTISGAVLEYESEKTVKLLEAKTIENGAYANCQ